MKIKILSVLLLLSLFCSVLFVACDDTTDDAGSAEGSVGLEYKTSDDGKSCTITGMGTCTDKDLKIPEKIDGLKVVAIGASAFSKNTELSSVIVPFGVKMIATNAFLACPSLSYVVLPGTLEKISSSAFRDCELLGKIYYEGTPSEWEDISIGGQNDPLQSASRLYYSDIRPESGGNYWHYVDGKPAQW